MVFMKTPQEALSLFKVLCRASAVSWHAADLAGPFDGANGCRRVARLEAGV
eukprot:CAMPEP_0174719712 /NCGR_PEP_ID=MMETSP1094-20130205/31802_1 /TAXON_ID=156173 /ORGANISM="Chrysochromulina brevifilum, Strain UTEX LB 985" /LENGTH=50 /DNA_ID=CAMNT_0015920065 /DNA_START=76 /DNA_END=228 /DNA_ORIENTATION=-